MIRQRLLLACPTCRQAKLIDVAVRDDGVMGVVKCDECKGRDILAGSGAKARTRRATSRTQPSEAANPEQATATSSGRTGGRLRMALGNLLGPTRSADKI